MFCLSSSTSKLVSDPQLVVLSLADDDKQNIAKALKKTQGPTQFSIGRPRFPEPSLTTALADLVNSDSWFLFHVLGQEEHRRHKWLEAEVSSWETYEDFKEFKAFIQSLDVLNDRAERGIKLIQGYISVPRNEKDLQETLAVVDNEK